MKSKLGKLIIFGIVLSLVFSMTACGNDKKTSEIRFATNPNFAPFEYKSEDGETDHYEGIDIAIATAIAEDNKLEMSIEGMEFDSLLLALQNGTVDAVISGLSITEERKESVDFSISYFTASQVMIVLEDSDITCAADMDGRNIAVVQGYTGEKCVQKLGYEYETFKKANECITELMNGKCEVVVLDSLTALYFVNSNPGLKIVTDESVFEKEEYAIAVKKGNDVLLDMINASLEKFLNDGTIDSIIVEYSQETGIN